MPRIFVALPLPHDACDALARDAKALSRYDMLARFTPSTNLHITLAFLGEVPMLKAQRLSAALRPLSRVLPREISLGRLGLFERTRVLWAGLTPAESLDALAQEVRRILDEMELNYDRKPFKAHITLARNWRRPLPYVTLPARSFRLTPPIVLASDIDQRTNQVRYRQIY